MITLKALPTTVGGLAFSPSGDRLAAVSSHGSVIWDTAIGGAEVARHDTHGYSVAFTPDGTTVAIAGGIASLWDLTSGTVTDLGSGAARSGLRIAVRPDGSMVCLAGTHWAIHYDAELDDVVRWSLPDHSRLPRWSEEVTTGGIAFSPDGETLASGHLADPTGTRSYTVLLRDPNEGTIRATLGGSTTVVTDLAFSPNGSQLASISGITLRVWDVDSGEELAARKVGSKHFKGFAFTPDGRSLLTVSNDKSVRVWETDTWTETSAYEWKIGRATSIAVAPDGLRAAVGGSTGKIILFDLEG